MKNFNILIVVFVFFLGCKQGEKSMETQSNTVDREDYEGFGAQMDSVGSLDTGFMFGEYQKLQNTDTISVKFSAMVTEVCQSKGCWMKLQLGRDREVMVKFKDYGFFMPKDIVGKEVVVNGLAFVDVMSVEDQRHFAEDGGKSEEEIANITVSKRTFSFLADGVLLKK